MHGWWQKIDLKRQRPMWVTKTKEVSSVCDSFTVCSILFLNSPLFEPLLSSIFSHLNTFHFFFGGGCLYFKPFLGGCSLEGGPLNIYMTNASCIKMEQTYAFTSHDQSSPLLPFPSPRVGLCHRLYNSPPTPSYSFLWFLWFQHGSNSLPSFLFLGTNMIELFVVSYHFLVLPSTLLQIPF